jgi:HK97 family phage portal protein
MPASHVVATRRGDRLVEQRSSLQGMWAGGGGGYEWADPAAIPPPGMQSMSRAGVLVTAHSLLGLDVVFTSLRLISNAILKMGDPYAYTEDYSDENIPYRKRRRDRPTIFKETFGGLVFQYDGRRKTIMSMALLGEAFWYVLARDKLAYPEAVEVLHPAFLEIKKGENGKLEYLYGTGANRKQLDPENLIHIPFMSLPQSMRGLNPVEYVAVSGALAMAAYQFGSTWFSQGAAPSFLMETDQKLGQAEVERIASKFIVEHSGLQSAHLPLVLDSGLKAKKVMASPDEAQYLNTLQYARSVVAAWFGTDELIPNAMQRQAETPAHTAQEKMQRFTTLTLSGFTIALEEAYGSMLPDEEKAGLDETRLLTPDPQFQAERIEKLRQAQVGSPNTLRVRELGWEPSADPEADQMIQPLASNVAPSQTEDKPEAGSDTDDDKDEPKDKP